VLTRLRVKNYKSLSDVEVELKPLSILFGPNSAGKSNFLDALQLLSQIASSRTLKEAFNPPYRGTPLESFTFGPKGIRGLLEEGSACFSLEVDVELSPWTVNSVNQQIREMRSPKGEQQDGKTSRVESLAFVKERFLRYRIDIEVLPKSGILRVADEYLAALNSHGQPTGKRRAFIERVKDRLHLRMEGQAHPTYFERYLDHSILSKPHYPPHYPHLVAMRQELSSWLFFYFEPRERMRKSTPVKEVRHIGLMGEELASFLNTLKALDEPQFRAIEKSLHMIIPSASGINLDVNDLGEVELKLIEAGIPVPARVLSEGTLRVLGLLALGGAKEPPSLLGFEEPENGIHPRRIRLIAELLKVRAATGNTQLIITTHSPTLLDLMPLDSLLVFKKREGLTEIKPFDVWGPIARQVETNSALDDEEQALPVSQRILRGDLDD
jgi:predicted ATPase